MTDRRLVLLRHGRTAWNAELRAQGHADVELDELGHAQAVASARALAAYSATLLVTSDLARAAQTAGYVAEAVGLEPERDRRLREYDVGTNRTGLTLDEYSVAHPDEHAHLLAGRYEQVEGRESVHQVGDRMVAALTDVAARLRAGQTAILVGHGAAIRTGITAFLSLPAGAETAFAALGNACWLELAEAASIFHGDPPRWRLAAYNCGA